MGFVIGIFFVELVFLHLIREGIFTMGGMEVLFPGRGSEEV
ncbi:hypothetical protein LEP1GSC061_3949 [Leptospira wolffii serovar Khorat str. Khorat-H2]|nr:hypothetical protein LEP1GSC061_3949 [Leptospira wolffii serovar Khorat str. Khorat-H2]